MGTATNTVPELRIAGPDDIDTIADIVAASFQHMSVIRWLVPNDQRRMPVTRAWYRLHIEHALTGAGQVIMTSDNTATAVWFDRTKPFHEPDDYANHLAELAGDDLPRFEHLDAQMDAHHPGAAHRHLLFLAALPNTWGQGSGSLLMNHTHHELDTDDVPAYLEATSEHNRRLYRRHGYTDMTPPVIPISDGIELYRMWRQPGTGPA
ncbi:GNAT family N-acetyltransferase [Actinoplanes sp. NPDC051861]|uniref:GNAT family N-acetyltransferase n=1 Tax=Actinoplanes sp. NPDC051861 TaxID=3155170 RepID=UPI003429974B